MLVTGLITGFAVVFLLVAERMDSQRGRWLFKPLASVGFCAFGLAAGALDSSYGLAMAMGLGLSLLGDLLLIPTQRRAFLAGIVVFLLAHLAFSAGFLLLGVSWSWTGLSALLLGLLAAGIGRWLLPSVPSELKGPVLAYILVIASMVALAMGALGAGGSPLIPVGATIFFLSDISVARQRFKGAAFTNKLWGLPAYYGAQLIFGLTVAQLG